MMDAVVRAKKWRVTARAPREAVSHLLVLGRQSEEDIIHYTSCTNEQDLIYAPKHNLRFTFQNCVFHSRTGLGTRLVLLKQL